MVHLIPKVAQSKLTYPVRKKSNRESTSKGILHQTLQFNLPIFNFQNFGVVFHFLELSRTLHAPVRASGLAGPTRAACCHAGLRAAGRTATACVATRRHTGDIHKTYVFVGSDGLGLHLPSPLRPSGSQALRASAGCAKRKQFPDSLIPAGT